METWKNIPGYKGYYQVNKKGEVKSLGRYIHLGTNRKKVWKPESILQPIYYTNGRKHYNLCRNGKSEIFYPDQIIKDLFEQGNPKLTETKEVIDFKKWLLKQDSTTCWKPVPGYENSYAFSSNGFLVSKSRYVRGRYKNSKRLMEGHLLKPLRSTTNKFIYQLSDKTIVRSLSIETLQELVFNNTNINTKLVENYFYGDNIKGKVNTNKLLINSSNRLDERAIIIEYIVPDKPFVLSKGWHSKDNLNIEPINFIKYKTCGFILEETELTITLCNGLQHDRVLNVLKILKANIIDRYDFKERGYNE